MENDPYRYEISATSRRSYERTTDLVLLPVRTLLSSDSLAGLGELKQICLQSLPAFYRVAESTKERPLEAADWVIHGK